MNFSELRNRIKVLFAKQRMPGSGLALFVILVISGSFMVYGAKTDSGTSDELPHIPSGYSYLRELDYRLNPEHPPLLKALSAVPLIFLNPTFPIKDSSWQTAREAEWDVGRIFLYESGNNADEIIFLSRLAPILLTLLLSLLIFIIGKELFGSRWALLPTTLFALSPSVLAHGHYVGTDMAGTFGMLLSTWTMLRVFKNASRKNIFIAGIAFGIAQLCKFSAILLIPYFFILALAWVVFASFSLETSYSERLKSSARALVIKLKIISLTMFIGYALLVYPMYFLFTVNYPVEKQTSDTEILLKSFAGGKPASGLYCTPKRCLAEGTIIASQYSATRPLAHYALGVLMVSQRIAGGNTNYFLGTVSNTGTGAYFPVMFLLKETIPTLIFLLSAFIITAFALRKSFLNSSKTCAQKIFSYFQNNFTQFSFALFVVCYWYVSLRSPLHIGFRHLMPTIPFLYLLMTSAWQKWDEAQKLIWKKFALVLSLLIWFVAETAFASPYFLSYFNQIGGGVSGGYRIATDSNYDWGQDFLRLRDWTKAHLHNEKIAIDYFGAASPSYYLPDEAVGWISAMGDPRDSGIYWLAVSVNTLETAFATPHYSYGRKPEDEYAWLTKSHPRMEGMGGVPKPDFRIGTSIFVYKL